MFFNSVQFLLFFLTFFIVYWFVLKKSLKLQNYLILLASYIFYGWWDWRFLFLLILSTFIDYFFGLIIDRTEKRKKLYLWLSIFNNLIILGFFKYYNFFAESFSETVSNFGFQVHPYILHIVLPVGISFYTFHGMSYVIDIYNKKAKPETNFVNYAVFVCFFPLLVAGPIERGYHLLPQVSKPRKFNFDQAMEGLRMILWGLFKKIIIADTLAITVNQIFGHYELYSASTLVLGAIYFSFQIYGDFSGYTDVAIGTAKLLGFELLTNFKFPYFSRDIAEFWRRWHISLSSWFRDYVYIPLGGSKGGKWMSLRNIFVIFILSGFWHGASWTYIVWGVYHAVLYIPLFVFNLNRKNTEEVVAAGKLLPSLSDFLKMLLTFILVTIGWVFFRSSSISFAIKYLASIVSTSLFTMPKFYGGLGLVIVFLVLDWLSRADERNPHKFIPNMVYIVLLTLVLLIFGRSNYENIEFIYFQF